MPPQLLPRPLRCCLNYLSCVLYLQLRDEKQGLFRNQPPFLGPSESEIARNLSRSKGVRFHCIVLQTKMCGFDFAPMGKSDVGGQCDFELAQLDFEIVLL